MKLKNSKILYKKSIKLIAAPSTFSKGVDNFAFGISPYAIKKGKGAYSWDVDGNKYLDTIMALGAVILGHANKEINNSIKKQLQKGISFSLTNRLEIDVAEMLCERIPCAEMVRFGKNGNDATTAAVRLARHYTNKDHVLFCGYHGWQDWYICKTSMNSGIPKDIKKYSHRFIYNDIENLEKLLIEFEGKTSCIIMEPVSRSKPICNKICNNCKSKEECQGYLKGVRRLANKYNVLLIFDEVATGFRFDRGGYQALSGVIPDLACFSKAMGNGMPISALVGKKEIMKKSNEIFYSLTYGGETLSLAATKTTLEILDKTKAYKKINTQGKKLINGIKKSIKAFNLHEVIKIDGFPCRNVLTTLNHPNGEASDIKTFLIQELNSLGVLSVGTNILSLSHDEAIINKLVHKYNIVFEKIKKTLENNSLSKKLKCPRISGSAREIL